VGEYTRSIFQVVGIALIVSWIAAVVFVPYLGDKLLPDLARLKAAKHGSTEGEHDPYATPLYRRIRAVITWCVTQRTLVIIITVLLFAGSIFTFRYVPKQFFADSNRLELLLNIKLAEGASLKATQAHVEKIEALLKDRPGIENYVAYIGSGSPRFYLPLDQQLPATSFAQFVMITDSLEQREEVREWLIETMHEQFPDVHSRITRLENGPPVGYPVQFRVTGEHIGQVRELARQVAAVVRNNPHVSNVHLDWEEPSKVVYLQIDQDRARAMGVSTASVSQFLRGALSGASVGQFREGNELIEILQRGTLEDREDLAGLGSLAIPTDYGTSVSLSQVATLEYGFEDGVIWHRDRLPNVTVRADIYGKDQAVDVVREILPQLQGVRDSLPDGYLLDVGGTVEDSTRGQSSVIAGMPLFLLVVLSLLMIQLRSFSRSVMVFLTAPLGLIGVTLFLLLFNQPFGFVAMLGTIALSGMIMRNSVILVDQIETDISLGHTPWQAVIDATVRRFRPITLTALAAVLAMIPLSRSVFFGPMAVAIMGGLIVATVLTLLFLPALYAAWFRVRKE
jgi:multidrug efflux pump